MSKGEAAPGVNTNEPAPSDDASRWAELAKELEADDLGQQQPPADKGQQAPAESGDSEGDEKHPPARGPVAYEEHENVQKALRAARESERQIREQMNGVTTLIESLRAQRQQPQQKAEEPAKLPSVEEDPIGHFTGQIAQLQQTIERLQNGTTQTQQQFEQDQQQRAFVSAVAGSEQAMRASTPDYDAACQHLEAGRVAELEAIYGDDNQHAVAMARHYGLPSVAHLRAAILNQDRIQVAQQALMLGQSPAEMYYRLALQRGYKAPEKQQEQQQQKSQQQLDAVRRGQKAAKSIGGGTGGGPDNGLSITDLTQLYADDPEAFDREWDKMARAGKLG